jgi:hypothetical protein
MRFNSLVLRCLLLPVTYLCAIPQSDSIALQVVQPDQASLLQDQIIAAINGSFESLYSDLYTLHITPINDLSTTRMAMKGSDILPLLTPTFFNTNNTSGYKSLALSDPEISPPITTSTSS